MKPKLKDHAVLAFSEFLEENKIQHFIMYKKNKSSIGVSLKGKNIDKMIAEAMFANKDFKDIIFSAIYTYVETYEETSNDEEELEGGDVRTVLHFHPALAPVKIGILPLSKKLNEGAEKIYAELSKKYNCEFDDRGNIGKRYRRQDEIGTPFCITYDFESEYDQAVTIRFRDSMEQVRVPIAELDAYFADKFTF